MFEDLLSHQTLHEASAEMYIFGGVILLRDFGPWKTGQQFPSLCFHLDKGICESYAADGATLVESIKFQLTANETQR
jgi:hypothetical protein